MGSVEAFGGTMGECANSVGARSAVDRESLPKRDVWAQMANDTIAAYVSRFDRRDRTREDDAPRWLLRHRKRLQTRGDEMKSKTMPRL